MIWLSDLSVFEILFWLVSSHHWSVLGWLHWLICSLEVHVSAAVTQIHNQTVKGYVLIFYSQHASGWCLPSYILRGRVHEFCFVWILSNFSRCILICLLYLSATILEYSGQDRAVLACRKLCYKLFFINYHGDNVHSSRGIYLSSSHWRVFIFLSVC